MAHYAKAKLTPQQAEKVRWLKELERMTRLVIEEIEIDGMAPGDAMAKIDALYNQQPLEPVNDNDELKLEDLI
jgi:hypothetical protein